MLEFGYHIIKSIVIRTCEGVELADRVCPKHLYKLYVRIFEAIGILETDILFTLNLYRSRQSDSDWWNFNVKVIYFSQKLAEIIEAMCNTTYALRVPELYTRKEIQNLCYADGKWFREFSEQYSNWVWDHLKKEKSTRIFSDYSTRISEMVPEQVHFASCGIIEGVEHFEIDFNIIEEFRDYHDQIKTKLVDLYKYLGIFSKCITKHCEMSEIL